MRKQLLLAMLTICICVPVSNAMEIGGVMVEDSLNTDNGVELKLNGAGIRSKFIFDIYIAELYLEETAKTTEDVIAATGAKRMVMHFLHKEVGKDKLVGAWNEGFEGNTDPEALPALNDRIALFNNLFVDVKKGDEISLDYSPEQGTAVTIGGQAKGVIPGKDFNDALLKIWLGKKPVTKKLKSQLLGG
jgi:hypothetical protein